MKNVLFFYLSILFFTQNSFVFSQNIGTEKFEFHLSNGTSILSVSRNKQIIAFNEKFNYFCYINGDTTFTITRGGCNGKILHGISKYFDKKGKLRLEKNINLGLLIEQKEWDEKGNIIDISKWENDKEIYKKYKNNNDRTIEIIGEENEKGTIRKIYNASNIVIEEDVFLNYRCRNIQLFYENGKPNEKSTRCFNFLLDEGDYAIGSYVSYFENGNIEQIGQYYDSKDEIKFSIPDGTWIYYNLDGSIENKNYFKVDIERYSNGKINIAGGSILVKDKWLKHGLWKWFSQDGKVLKTLKYELDKVLKEK